MPITKPTYDPNALPLEAVITTPEFLALTPLQRRFIVRYVDQAQTNKAYDATDAFQHAYGDVRNIKLRSYQILRNKRVKKVLDIHFRRSGLETILADLQRAARQSVKLKLGLTPATVKALAAFEAYIAASCMKSKDSAETSQEHDKGL